MSALAIISNVFGKLRFEFGEIPPEGATLTHPALKLEFPLQRGFSHYRQTRFIDREEPANNYFRYGAII
jgi:hypothetical protein